jgi:hypothetical protein
VWNGAQVTAMSRKVPDIMLPTDQPHVKTAGTMQPEERSRAWLACIQGVVYLATGVWPLVSMRTFERVTGPKVDRWLVKTVGVLVTVIGGVLIVAGRRRTVSDELLLLAAGSAAGLAGIDVVYSTRGRISKVYLLDALGELALVAGWLRLRRRSAST